MEAVNSKAPREETIQKGRPSSIAVNDLERSMIFSENRYPLFGIMLCDSEVLSGPIGGQRPEFVADVETDVIALLINDEVGRSRGGPGQLLAFGRRYDLVAGAEYHQQRAFDAVRTIRKAQPIGDRLRHTHVGGMAAD